MLAAQMLASHYAAMECYRRAMIGEQTFEGRRESLSQPNKLSRTYAVLLEGPAVATPWRPASSAGSGADRRQAASPHALWHGRPPQVVGRRSSISVPHSQQREPAVETGAFLRRRSFS
jgi:hypothetical protein